MSGALSTGVHAICAFSYEPCAYSPGGGSALLPDKFDRVAPVFLALSLVQVAFVLWFYRKAIHWQGILLQQNEQKILEVVSAKSE